MIIGFDLSNSFLILTMPTTLVVPSDIQVFFYYVFHVIFLGHPADILARLWLAHDLAHPVVLQPGQDEGATIRLAWKNFEDSIRESYRTVGVSVGAITKMMTLHIAHIEQLGRPCRCYHITVLFR